MLAWVTGGRVVAVFPGSAEADVTAQAGDHQVWNVPYNTAIGSTYNPVTLQWEAPPPADQGAHRWLSAYLFRLRFTALEEAAVIEAAKTNALVSVGFNRLTAPQLVNVDLDAPETIAGVQLLTMIDNPFSTETPKEKILSAERATEVLT